MGKNRILIGGNLGPAGREPSSLLELELVADQNRVAPALFIGTPSGVKRLNAPPAIFVDTAPSTADYDPGQIWINPTSAVVSYLNEAANGTRTWEPVGGTGGASAVPMVYAADDASMPDPASVPLGAIWVSLTDGTLATSQEEVGGGRVWAKAWDSNNTPADLAAITMVANAATRNALPAAQLQEGSPVFQEDTAELWLWKAVSSPAGDDTDWAKVASGSGGGTGGGPSDADFASLTGRVAANETGISGVTSDLTALTSRVTANEGAIGTLDGTSTDHETRIATLEASGGGGSPDLTALTARVATNETDISALQSVPIPDPADVTANANAIGALQTDMTQAKADITALQAGGGGTPAPAPKRDYRQVSDLKASTETYADDDVVTAEGWFYRAIAAGGGEIQNAAGTGFHLISDVTTPTARGVGSLPDPSPRATAAAPTVTALKSRRLYGITLRDILGVRYDPTNDAAAVLNAFLAEIAAEGLVVRDPDATEVLLAAPLVLVSGLRMELSPRTRLMKGFAGVTPAEALLAPADMAADVDDVRISGGVLAPVDAAQTGSMVAGYGNGWQLSDMQIMGYHGAPGVLIGGDLNRVHNLTINTDDTDVTAMGVRVVGGLGFRGSMLRVNSGGHCMAFAPITQDNEPRFDQSIAGGRFTNSVGASAAGAIAIATISFSTTGNKQTATVSDCTFEGITGAATVNGCKVENNSGDGTNAKQLDQIVFTDCAFDLTASVKTEPPLDVFAANGNSAGSVTFNNVSVRKNPAPNAAMMRAADAHMLFSDCHLEAEAAALMISQKATVRIHAGTFSLVDAGGGGTPGDVILMGGGAADSLLTVTALPRIENIPTGKGGIRLSSGTGRGLFDRIQAFRAPGATNVSAIMSSPGAAIDHDGGEGDIDNETGGGGTYRTRAWA